MPSWTHVLAVVVGASRPDGDIYTHFGSLRAINDHLAAAERLGLMRPAPEPVAYAAPEFVTTDAGRAFVEHFRLAELPAGRANNWGLRHSELTEPAIAELARRWDVLHASSQDGAA